MAQSVPLFWCYQCREVIPIASGETSSSSGSSQEGEIASGTSNPRDPTQANNNEQSCPLCGGGFLESVQTAEIPATALFGSRRGRWGRVPLTPNAVRVIRPALQSGVLAGNQDARMDSGGSAGPFSAREDSGSARAGGDGQGDVAAGQEDSESDEEDEDASDTEDEAGEEAEEGEDEEFGDEGEDSEWEEYEGEEEDIAEAENPVSAESLSQSNDPVTPVNGDENTSAGSSATSAGVPPAATAVLAGPPAVPGDVPRGLQQVLAGGGNAAGMRHVERVIEAQVRQALAAAAGDMADVRVRFHIGGPPFQAGRAAGALGGAPAAAPVPGQGGGTTAGVAGGGHVAEANRAVGARPSEGDAGRGGRQGQRDGAGLNGWGEPSDSVNGWAWPTEGQAWGDRRRAMPGGRLGLNRGDFMTDRELRRFLADMVAREDGGQRGNPPAARAARETLEEVVVAGATGGTQGSRAGEEDGEQQMSEGGDPDASRKKEVAAAEEHGGKSDPNGDEGEQEVSWRHPGWTCSVCKEVVEAGDVVSALPCRHAYHTACIRPWLEARNSCPICRFELPTDDSDYEQRRQQALAYRATAAVQVQEERRENGPSFVPFLIAGMALLAFGGMSFLMRRGRHDRRDEL